MIVDTSAIIAILQNETEGTAFISMMIDAPVCLISAGSWIELTAVNVRRFPGVTRDDISSLLRNTGSRIEPVTLEQAEIAEQAYRTYGRGTGHPARLNFGDCFAYALAKATGQKLLFKGDDFSRTDIQPAYS